MRLCNAQTYNTRSVERSITQQSFSRHERSSFNSTQTNGTLMIKKADQTIISTTAPASATNDEIFTAMSRTRQDRGALAILIVFSITSTTDYYLLYS